MDLFEYQARELFAAYGVPVLDAFVATSAEEAHAAAEKLGGTVVVKAQVKTGGRGKAGGVKLARNPEEAANRARDILGMDIKGHHVRTVLVARGADIAEEYYLSLLIDRSARTYLAMLSREGGVDIEQLARERPEALVRVPIDPGTGLDAAKAAEIVAAGGFSSAVAPAVTDVLLKLWHLFTAEDALLVEVNPLVRTADGSVIALDAKVTLDDNARFRHPGHLAFVETVSADPLEQLAKEKGLSYVKLDGEVGVIGNGAGLVMSTLDVVAFAGEEFGGVRPANFLDIGGGASDEVMTNGLRIVLSDPRVKVVFVNVFGGITACDAVAHGIKHAFEMLSAHDQEVCLPIVVRLDGNNAELGQEIIENFAETLPLGCLELVATMDGAARRAAELAGARRGERA